MKKYLLLSFLVALACSCQKEQPAEQTSEPVNHFDESIELVVDLVFEGSMESVVEPTFNGSIEPVAVTHFEVSMEPVAGFTFSGSMEPANHFNIRMQPAGELK